MIKKKLKGYKLLVLVGDHWPREMVPALEEWVKAGGVALATAASGQRDEYGETIDDFHKLAGHQERQDDDARDVHPAAAGAAVPEAAGRLVRGYEKYKIPCLATEETFEAEGKGDICRRSSRTAKAARRRRKVGKGGVIYAALTWGWRTCTRPCSRRRCPTAGRTRTRCRRSSNPGVRVLLDC